MPHTPMPLFPSFTVNEIALAAGVPVSAVRELVTSGDLRPIPGTKLFSAGDAVRAGRLARGVAVASSRHQPTSLLRSAPSLPALASSLVHALFVAVLVWSTSGTAETAAVPVQEQPRLVFLTGPGPGGGGGSQGRAARTRVPRVTRPSTPPPQPTPLVPEPLASRALVMPVAISAGDQHLEAAEEDGAGPGLGPGLGDGTGGGAGGGPFRAGSGIDAPRLLREVKARYTDEARRRGVTGEVILEIVIRSDGTVGDIRMVRGLGSGLDERAMTAVGQWRFAPARRFGEAVDVIVEVAVEFSLR